MDAIKIQTEVMKALRDNQPVKYFKNGDDIYLAFNNHMLFVIPECECYLNLTFGKREPCESCKKVIDTTLKNQIPAQFKGVAKMLNDGKIALRLESDDMKSPNAQYTYVAEKSLKFFGKAKDLKFTIKARLAPVAVYAPNGIFLGVISPIIVKEE